MIVKGVSPDFLITHFELNYADEANFLNSFVSIGERIVFPYFESNFKNEEITWKRFVEDRTVFKSQSWSFYGNLHRNVYWYSPNCIEELVNVIEKDPFTYVCFIIPENHNNNLNNYSYFIHVVEHLEDPEDVNEEMRGMFLEESYVGSFQKRIFPKLKNQFKFKGELFS